MQAGTARPSTWRRTRERSGRHQGQQACAAPGLRTTVLVRCRRRATAADCAGAHAGPQRPPAVHPRQKKYSWPAAAAAVDGRRQPARRRGCLAHAPGSPRRPASVARVAGPRGPAALGGPRRSSQQQLCGRHRPHDAEFGGCGRRLGAAAARAAAGRGRLPAGHTFAGARARVAASDRRRARCAPL